jgi:hypothetical protein
MFKSNITQYFKINYGMQVHYDNNTSYLSEWLKIFLDIKVYI